MWIRGAMVARLTPDQKVACSIHVGFNSLGNPHLFFLFCSILIDVTVDMLVRVTGLLIPSLLCLL
ncbi:hypothetical protein MTR_5g043010 [Medicago truncatula]|uniref:Uncharacterized protein n=1 Tax=Medicago truncatula TaxID=3880 RepID=G7JWN7_MEDTR|nr:hypothetical protein MTR_5g043010 [Medicago truncatula]